MLLVVVVQSTMPTDGEYGARGGLSCRGKGPQKAELHVCVAKSARRAKQGINAGRAKNECLKLLSLEKRKGLLQHSYKCLDIQIIHFCCLGNSNTK